MKTSLLGHGQILCHCILLSLPPRVTKSLSAAKDILVDVRSYQKELLWKPNYPYSMIAKAPGIKMMHGFLS